MDNDNHKLHKLLYKYDYLYTRRERKPRSRLTMKSTALFVNEIFTLFRLQARKKRR